MAKVQCLYSLYVDLSEYNDVISNVAFSPNGHLIAVALGNNTMRIWRVSGGQSVTKIGRA